MRILITDATDINTVLRWAMGHRTSWPGAPAITDENATDAAKRLTAKAYKSLSAGLRPEQVTLKRRPPEDLTAALIEPACRVCGCTENEPCRGGCCWVEDPKTLGELCSSCAVLLKQWELL